MISASRAGGRLALARRFATSSFQFRSSGILQPRDAIDGFDEFQPSTPLCGQNAATLFGEAVIAAPPLAGLLYPTAVDPAALFEPVEQWIERSDTKLDCPFGTLFDQLADVVPMAGLIFQ